MLGLLLFSVALSSPQPAGQPLLIAVPENVAEIISSGRAKATGTRSDIGGLSDIFDGDPSTLYRTPSINPAEITVVFNEPREVPAFRLLLRFKSRYTILAAPSEAELATAPTLKHEGQTNAQGEALLDFQRLFGKPLRASAFRLHVHRIEGDDYVHIEDWQFARLVPAERIEVEMIPARPEWKPFSKIPARGVVRMRAAATAEGARQDVTDSARWIAEGFERWPEGGPHAWRARHGVTRGVLQAAAANLSGSKEFEIVPWSRENLRPDVNVLFIEKTPRRNYDAPDAGNGPGWPANGQEIVWRAHVQSHNREARDLRWEATVDGKLWSSGTIDRIPKDGIVQVPIPMRWQQARQELEFKVDAPAWDSNPHNNGRRIHTDALTVGFWIEDRLWQYWHDLQHRQNPRNETFEDWSQHMIDLWNGMMEKAVYPGLTPNGNSDRWRLDRVIIVPSGALPLNGGLPSNNPDSRDRTVDIAWGFAMDPDATVSKYWELRPDEKDAWTTDAAFLTDRALIHELLHARYLVDSYGFDVHASSIKVEVDGKPLIGSLLPDNFARFNKYKGVMGGGIRLHNDEFVAGALERVAGKRARGGNMNSPTVIGEYLNDLPKQNRMTFELPDGAPAAGAELLIYQAKPRPTDWYGKEYSGEPDLRLRLDGTGSAEVGRSPFGPVPLRHTFGHANTVALMLVRHQGKVYVHFQEATDFNLAFWRGQREFASYTARLVEPPQASE
jgi:hypothetical protein